MKTDPNKAAFAEAGLIFSIEKAEGASKIILLLLDPISFDQVRGHVDDAHNDRANGNACDVNL